MWPHRCGCLLGQMGKCQGCNVLCCNAANTCQYRVLRPDACPQPEQSKSLRDWSKLLLQFCRYTVTTCAALDRMKGQLRPPLGARVVVHSLRILLMLRKVAMYARLIESTVLTWFRRSVIDFMRASPFVQSP